MVVVGVVEMVGMVVGVGVGVVGVVGLVGVVGMGEMGRIISLGGSLVVVVVVMVLHVGVAKKAKKGLSDGGDPVSFLSRKATLRLGQINLLFWVNGGNDGMFSGM